MVHYVTWPLLAQPHIQAAARRITATGVSRSTRTNDYQRRGTGKPNLKLLGTSFWPDIEISEGGTRRAAIEVKLIHPRQRASHAIAEAIGQSVIYSIRILTFSRSSQPQR